MQCYFLLTNICTMNIMTISGPLWLCVEDSSKVSSNILLTLYSFLFQLQCFPKFSKMAALLQLRENVNISAIQSFQQQKLQVPAVRYI